MKQKQVDASHKVEELSMDLKELVAELRSGVLPDSEAYAKLYHIRTRLGRVVATLGAGAPTGSWVDGRPL